MSNDSIFPELPGATAIINWFGYWPDFHDDEILEVHLNRNGSSWIKVFASDITGKRATVTFFFEVISDLELFDFSIQNVVGSIIISRNDEEIRLTIAPCYGIGGYIQGILSKVECLPDI